MKKICFAMSMAAALIAINSTSVYAKAFAPYVDVTLWPTPQIDKIGVTQGIQQFNLAFINSNGTCAPYWGGIIPISGDNEQVAALNSGIKNYRAKGGEIAISFGGALGIPLQQACDSNSALQAAYQTVLDTYDVDRIDFDVEGAAQNDAVANHRNFSVVAALQQIRQGQGKNLHVTLTLPTLTRGLTKDGLGVLGAALDNNVELDHINIMAMDYDQQNQTMGQAAIEAAQALYVQIDTAYKAHGEVLTPKQLWDKVGVTPMVGMNDTVNETFAKDNANELYEMANQNGVGLLSMWSVTRDQACPGKGAYVDASCSGINQNPYDFTSLFKGYSEHWGAGVTQDPNYGSGGMGGDPQPWSASQTYQGGEKVIYMSAIWKAKWWTKGDVPGTADVWEEVK